MISSPSAAPNHSFLSNKRGSPCSRASGRAKIVCFVSSPPRLRGRVRETIRRLGQPEGLEKNINRIHMPWISLFKTVPTSAARFENRRQTVTFWCRCGKKKIHFWESFRFHSVIRGTRCHGKGGLSTYLFSGCNFAEPALEVLGEYFTLFGADLAQVNHVGLVPDHRQGHRSLWIRDRKSFLSLSHKVERPPVRYRVYQKEAVGPLQRLHGRELVFGL